MRHAGQSFLLLLSFFSLQLSLLGGGSGCAVASVFAHAGAGSAATVPVGMSAMDMANVDMAGMDMGGMDMSGMDMTSPDAAARRDVGPPTHDEQSCDDPRTSAGCDSMTVCAFAAVTSPGSMRAVLPAPPSPVPTLAVRTPPTDGDAPELPPPRAWS